MDSEGICFEVKRKTNHIYPKDASSQKDNLCASPYRLQLVGSLPVHILTTMPMLPWIVADICRQSTKDKSEATRPFWVNLYISQTVVRCVLDTGCQQQWDPLHYNVVFEHSPQSIYKLIHNSNEPSYFACLIKEEVPKQPEKRSICYVFRSVEETKVPEIISTLRQAGKIARQEDAQPQIHDQDDAFAKKFEVLFCGKVTVPQKKAPPALIDECIEKFSRVCAENKDTDGASEQGQLYDQSWSLSGDEDMDSLRTSTSANNTVNSNSADLNFLSQSCQRTTIFRKNASLQFLPNIGENNVSTGILRKSSSVPCGILPTNIQENRTMLFTIGQAQIYLISPDTKKVAIEKSFKEISFCSQGIRHVDHFGFICREPLENGNCHFVCYVFQCTNESLVDEIMMTLKQTFSVAAVQQNSRTQPEQCESCPLQCLHKLCESLEGLHPSKAKLELQRHLGKLSNKEQATIFEKTLKARPKSDLEENELIMSILRSLYEEKQKSHVHSHSGDIKQGVSEDMSNELNMSAGRLRLEQLKSRAKRSLTESLEGILSRGNSKLRDRKESGESVQLDHSSSSSELHSLSRNSSVSELHVENVEFSHLKSHGSTGDLKQLECASHGPPCQEFRRRASTFSYMPSHNQQPLPRAEEITSIPKPKLMRHYSVSTETPHKRNLNTSDSDDQVISSPLSNSLPPARQMPSSPNIFKTLKANTGGEQTARTLKKSDIELRARAQGDSDGSPVKNRRHSWRQQIFLRVATPQKPCDASSRIEDAPEIVPGSPLSPMCGENPLGPVIEEKKKTPQELRELWKKTIMQQILLLRMEKENQKLQASETNLQTKRLKLDYEEITPCLKEVTVIWEKMLNTPGRSKVKFDMEKIHAAVGQGVPRHLRGEIWKFLAEQHQIRQQLPIKQSKGIPYKELLKQLTSQQHAILIDLGRTFPTHPYFSVQLGAGQLSLYNLLKAYSLLDPEVGYCQGLSFVAGVLLLHMSEDDAFEKLRFLMYDMGLRKQYRPDMIILQIQMYQLSRLLHDFHKDLYNHLECHEIGPSLYAAPWFLTMFASQFPLGFVARVFDMIFLQGAEVIFKVALSLLGSHKPLILQHDNLEAIVDFIKTTLPNLGLVQMEKTINQVFKMDISKQLLAYEVEYHVLQDELMDSSLPLSDNAKMEKLERTNTNLRQQNIDLLEELQAAHAKIHSLEAHVENLMGSEGKLKQTIQTLELERAALLNTIEDLRAQMASTATTDSQILGRTETHEDGQN
ncbi:TBC1 domain family member 1 isoform X2 [Polypterus senegalus]|uniref:TBC1 domain family member 1 isoform X2 n=1 Tax=Polypterus senegalus TaxID=55291 RepID=UPI0019642D3F|nr:TBC1 domain family member 1 isoform X2 [Polypterus senegalus]